MENARKTLGCLLADAREKLSLSRDGVGRLIGLSEQQVREIEMGQYGPLLSSNLNWLRTKLFVHARKVGIVMSSVEPLINAAVAASDGFGVNPSERIKPITIRG